MVNITEVRSSTASALCNKENIREYCKTIIEQIWEAASNCKTNINVTVVPETLMKNVWLYFELKGFMVTYNDETKELNIRWN